MSGPDTRLQPTALVHEAYAKLLRQDQHSYRNQTHFLAVAARVMRRILIDHARIHRAGKRDQGRPKLALEEACESAIERPAVMAALADVLEALERKDAAKARLIELRYFGGLTLDETAEVTGIAVESVRHQFRVARAFLPRELDGSGQRLSSNDQRDVFCELRWGQPRVPAAMLHRGALHFA